MQISKKVAVLFSVLGLAAGTAGTIAFQTHAAGTTPTTTGTATTTGQHMRGTPPAAMGSVTAVSGNTITVTDKKSGTSYTVDATNATIEKFTPPAAGSTPSTPPARPTPTAITVSGISVGDNVTVQGTISGSNITATKITDGIMFGRGFSGGAGPGSAWMGRGGPRGAFGTVASVSGNTITLTGKNGTTYTVDASGATVNKITKSDVSGIAVGDTLMVNGTTSGNNVTAKNITDGIGNFTK